MPQANHRRKRALERGSIPCQIPRQAPNRLHRRFLGHCRHGYPLGTHTFLCILDLHEARMEPLCVAPPTREVSLRQASFAEILTIRHAEKRAIPCVACYLNQSITSTQFRVDVPHKGLEQIMQSLFRISAEQNHRNALLCLPSLCLELQAPYLATIYKFLQ